MEMRFLDVAESELDQATQYDNHESPGQGDLFLVEALSAIERINNFPEAWQSFTSNTRRCQLRRFPYAIIYQILDNEILVVAVANLHRQPDYWQDRMKGQPNNPFQRIR